MTAARNSWVLLLCVAAAVACARRGAPSDGNGVTPAGDADPPEVSTRDSTGDAPRDAGPADGSPPDGGGDAGAAALAVSIHESSRAGARLQARPAGANLGFPPDGGMAPANDPAGFVVGEQAHQSIIGFGASFLEAGMVCLNSLPTREAQDEVLRKLFDRETGAGFSVMKTVIGGTDFQSATPAWYTYADTPGDVDLARFSIARDLGPSGLITYIRRARAVGGQFQLEAPMDYPPDWMLVDVDSNQNVDRRYHDALARYYLKYLREYEKEGITIDYLALFNEPGGYTTIPFEDIRDLLADHVGPLFARENIRTKVLPAEAYYRSHAHENYPKVLDDPRARQYAGGIGYHGYDWKNFDLIADLRRRYPELPIWMAEICCLHPVSPDFEHGDGWAKVIFDDLEAGASVWMYWNMILDERGGPWLVDLKHKNPENNSQHPVVIVDRTRHTVSYTGLYYYLAHFGRFVRPGAQRLEVTRGATVSPELRALAFRNADGGMVVQILNSADSARPVRLTWRGRQATVDVAAWSITTLRWPGG